MFDMHRTVLKQSAIGSAMFFEVPKLNKVTHSVQGLFLLRKNFIEEGNTMLFQTKCFFDKLLYRKGIWLTEKKRKNPRNSFFFSKFDLRGYVVYLKLRGSERSFWEQNSFK